MKNTKYTVALTIFFVAFAYAGMSMAHITEEILQCSVFSSLQPIHTPKRTQETIAQQGMLGEVYDVTGDGIPDLATYSATMGGYDIDGTVLHSHEPLFYEIDENGDGRPDMIYVNPTGVQSCESILPYKKLDMNKVRGGIVNWF